MTVAVLIHDGCYQGDGKPPQGTRWLMTFAGGLLRDWHVLSGQAVVDGAQGALQATVYHYD